MKILITSLVDLKKSQHNRPHEFVRYLSKKHDVTIISINDWWKERQIESNVHQSQFDNYIQNAEYHYITNNKLSPILQECLFRKRAANLAKRDFDVHLNYNSLVAGYQVSKKIPTVFDIADDLTAMIRNSPQIPSVLRPIGGMIGDYYMRKNIENAKKITLTTTTLKNSYTIPDEKIELIPNGVDTTHFRNFGNTKCEMGLEGYIIGYVGVLREWVNFQPIFEAIKKLPPEFKMMVIGKEGNYEQNIALAKTYGVSDRVIFLGGIPYQDVPKYICAMDLCVIPFKRDDISAGALPLKLFEYLACERPVISTRLPGVKEVAKDRIFYADTGEEYTNIIKRLYSTEICSDQQKMNREFVINNYDWYSICHKMENVLEVAS
jgi:glycosyltransferase involved in cell wall biosynthesis